MKSAGYCILISAVLHVAGVIMTGFASATLPLLIPAAVYLLLSAGLARGKFWVAWIAFIAMLVGAAGAMSQLVGTASMPTWALWGILGADLAAAALLFGAIWSGPKTQTEI